MSVLSISIHSSLRGVKTNIKFSSWLAAEPELRLWGEIRYVDIK